MFNVRIKRFANCTYQIQLFSRAQRSAGEVSRIQFDHNTGEILPSHKGELTYNPFTAEFEYMTEYSQHSAERSALKSASRTVNSIYDIARSNVWDWFVTLTFDGNKVDRYDYKVCCNKVHYWLSNMHKICPYMIYLVVPEQHKDGAWHFHGLFTGIDDLDMRPSGHKDKKGRIVYNCLSYKWGFSTATRVADSARASGYLCKYITKDLCKATSGKKRYWCARNVRRPIVEEYMIEETVLNRLKNLSECTDGAFVKTLSTPYTDITYIDNFDITKS